jgi:hypothetical protein
MNYKLASSVLLLSSLAFADTIVLKSGRSIQGTFLSGDSRQIRMAVDDRVDVFPINDVEQIRFGNDTVSQRSSSGSSSTSSSGTTSSRRTPPVTAEPAEPITNAANSSRGTASQDRSRSGPTEIPSGTNVVIRMIDDIDSQRDRVGQEFRASVDEPVVIDGETVIARNANVLVKLVDDKQSGKLSGRTELTLDLVSVDVMGRSIDVNTQEVTQASTSRTGRTAKVVGGTAALGAVIGAIAGGGKGAAIGAATGAAAGGAVQVVTKGQQVRIPSETRLTFTLSQPISLNGR